MPIRLSLLVALVISTMAFAAEPIIRDVAVRPLHTWETGVRHVAGPTNPMILGDRFVYDGDDQQAQFYLMLPDTQPTHITLTREGDGEPMAAHALDHLEHPKVHFRIHVAQLPPGRYTVGASSVAPFTFLRTTDRAERPAWPEGGVPITLHAQDALADVDYPTRAGVPLPPNAVNSAAQLALYDGDQRVPAQIIQRGAWGAGGSAKWVHVQFDSRYRAGAAPTYHLRRSDAPIDQLPTPLAVEQTDDRITVDTGVLKFTLARTGFAGIDKAWHDATGKQQYDDAHLVIDGEGGPYLVDERMIRFDAVNGSDVSVAVEEQSAYRVVILATGWYNNPERRVDPICIFRTRLIATANSPLVRVQHNTILALDTRMHRIADLGFRIAAKGGTYQFGVDGKAIEGATPASGEAFIHQDRYDHLRIVEGRKQTAEGERSDGWFAVPRLTMLMRDVWQKFPKEVSVDTSGMTLHFWPKHGHRAFENTFETSLEEIYKYWCFHQHRLLDLNLPAEYFTKLQEYPSTFECVPEHAAAGNGQGLSIGADFALLFGDADPGAWAKLYQQDPIGHAPAQWNAGTGAMGEIAAADDPRFAETERAIEEGFLSYTRSVERGNNYGMWNYADTHTYWDVERNRPQLHRVWHNSHYHEVGKTWLLYFRSHSKRLLDWARASTDHYINVDTINYHDPDNPIKFHNTGAMYHCKAPTHWGSEAYGMRRRDGHAALFAHFVDPDASLWSWYIDANPRAGDVFKQYHEAVRRTGLPHAGTRREANTSLAVAVNLYRATHDADLLPGIHGMGRSLREDEPLLQQNPGPMWHPMWINRYYDLTRDPRYEPFIAEFGKYEGIKDTWIVALSALGYRLSGDTSYLTNHFNRLDEMPRRMYHAPGDAYDWYGWGPGPLGSRWFWMGWPTYLKQLQRAGFSSIERTSDPKGAYPFTSSDRRFPDQYAPSLEVCAVEASDGPIQIKVVAQSLGGDLHKQLVRIISPSGKRLHEDIFPPHGGPSGWTYEQQLPADGETGVYRITFHSHAAHIEGPITDMPIEGTLARPGVGYRTSRLYAHVQPLPATAPVKVTIASGNDWRPCDYRVSDAAGKLIATGSLFRPRDNKQIELTLDPAQHPLPWLIDVVGINNLRFDGKVKGVLFAPDGDRITKLREAIEALEH